MCPWHQMIALRLPWPRGWTLIPRGEKLFLVWALDLNPKRGKLPPVVSASSGGQAFPARDFLSHKAALQNLLGLP